MPLTKVGSSAFTPGAHEVVIQPGANQRAGNRDQAPRPLLHCFPAGLHGDALNDSGHKAVDYFFLHQLAADVHASGAGGGNPELRRLLVGVEFEAVEQAELLDRAQGDCGEDAEVRNNRENSAQPETCAFSGCDLHAAADDAAGHIVEVAHFHRVDAMKACDRHSVSSAQLEQELGAVHFDGLIGVLKAATQAVLEAASKPGFANLFSHL